MVHFFSGDIIFNEGDEGDTAYVIESGRVEIFRSGDGILAVLEAGQMFGEIAPMDHVPRNASARALTEVILREIEVEADD